ncbi:glutaminase [Swaminathania salitolerans]|uniref:Glutaminase n=1 Tax=Swaminathania salitolerans TaxID=182838 RepID=A0A511BLH2_9PROT|nr:glutaminase [Swaminathania salitolerans]GBQ09904.1 glutaminase [Swaminathania salitolerans LMG 21291]GEL01095.1 glutaminase [Swaminathania salitolerans]
MAELGRIVTEIVEELRPAVERGRVADYIPPLARVDPQKFGIAVIDASGAAHLAGDAEEAFSIQSLSKVFGLTLALNLEGSEIWRRVRQEPSGSAFNSIVQLESEQGIPRNPFINAGAIVIADILVSRWGRYAARQALLDLVSPLVGTPGGLGIDEDMAMQERETGFRNAALANYMRTFGNLHNPVDDTLDLYFHQCALTMSCRQLAEIGGFLMNGGTDPRSGRVVTSVSNARTIMALMMMCGHYDGSGAFAIRVGLPGKSGVGGGILAIAPGLASIAVWSPGLNAQGNSLLGTLALERLVQKTGWSVFNAFPLSVQKPG